MPHRVKLLLIGGLAALVVIATLAIRQTSSSAQAKPSLVVQSFDSVIDQNAQRMLEEGRRIFRFDTFGSEDFWGGKLRLHESIVGEKLGGVGPGVSPKVALSLGLKVDAEALPAALVELIKAGRVDLNDPASTVALLKANAVVGVTAFLNPDDSVKAVGIQCALCHSTVDDSFAPGIGRRLDGWANRDLNIGAIVATAPNRRRRLTQE